MLYTADTLPGSSGSPVYGSEYGKILALHHRGTEDTHTDTNRGVLAARIASWLDKNVTVHDPTPALEAPSIAPPVAHDAAITWSATEVANSVAHLGSAFQPYSEKLLFEGVDGRILVKFYGERKAWIALGVNKEVHIERLLEFHCSLVRTLSSSLEWSSLVSVSFYSIMHRHLIIKMQ